MIAIEKWTKWLWAESENQLGNSFGLSVIFKNSTKAADRRSPKCNGRETSRFFPADFFRNLLKKWALFDESDFVDMDGLISRWLWLSRVPLALFASLSSFLYITAFSSPPIVFSPRFFFPLRIDYLFPLASVVSAVTLFSLPPYFFVLSSLPLLSRPVCHLFPINPLPSFHSSVPPQFTSSFLVCCLCAFIQILYHIISMQYSCHSSTCRSYPLSPPSVWHFLAEFSRMFHAQNAIFPLGCLPKSA